VARSSANPRKSSWATRVVHELSTFTPFDDVGQLGRCWCGRGILPSAAERVRASMAVCVSPPGAGPCGAAGRGAPRVCGSAAYSQRLCVAGERRRVAEPARAAVPPLCADARAAVRMCWPGLAPALCKNGHKRPAGRGAQGLLLREAARQTGVRCPARVNACMPRMRASPVRWARARPMESRLRYRTRGRLRDASGAV
jgi:hypothetical protein